MTKKAYTNPSMKVSLFETEDVVTASGYDDAETAIKSGAFKIDGSEDSSVVRAIFEF